MTMSRLDRVALRLVATLPDPVVEKLSREYGVSPAYVRTVESSLPDTRQRDLVVEWILNNITYWGLRWPEDMDRALRAADFFFRHVRTPQWASAYEAVHDEPIEPRWKNNLLSYSMSQIEDVREQIEDPPEKDYSEQFSSLPAGADLVYNQGGVSVVKVTDADAACQLARGTRWCTSNRETAEHYLGYHPLYVIYQDGRKVGQMHAGTDWPDFQYMDRKDSPLEVPVPVLVAIRDLYTRQTGVLHDLIERAVNDRDEGPQIVENLLDNAHVGMAYQVALHSPMGAVIYLRGRPGWAEREFPEGVLTGVVLRDPWAVKLFAMYIAGGRWHEGEPVLIEAARDGDRRPLVSYFRGLAVTHEHEAFVRDHPEAWRMIQRDFWNGTPVENQYID